MSDQTVIDAPPAEEGVNIWPRIAFMVAFAIMSAIAQNVLLLIAVLQALWIAFSRQPNARIARFGASLAAWQAGVARFQSCADEAKPFPWADWPQGR